MMDSNVKADVAGAVEDFKKYSIRISNNIEKTLNKMAMIVEREAKQSFKGRDDESINGEPPRVDTGRLRASITHRLEHDEGGNTEAYIGTNVEYAADVEHGTSRTWPHPYMVPALEKNLEYIYGEIGKTIKEAENA